MASATIAAVATVAGAATTAIGAEESASAQAASAKYNAQVAANNQSIANQNAQLAQATGEQKAAQQGQAARAQVGAIKAAFGASGVDPNSGSALNVQSSAAQLGELSALQIKSNAAQQAYGYEAQGQGYGEEQQLSELQAQEAPIAGDISAASSILGGAGSAGNQYAVWQAKSGPNAPPAVF
jgi:hypothetical protein